MYVEMLDIKYLMGKKSAKKLDFVSFFRMLFVIVLRYIFRAFAKLQKAIISFVKSVCPSFLRCFCLPVCLHGTTLLPLCGFS